MSSTSTEGLAWIADVTKNDSTETLEVYNLVAVSPDIEQPPEGVRHIQAHGVVEGLRNNTDLGEFVIGLYAGPEGFEARYPDPAEIFRGPGEEKPASIADMRKFLHRQPKADTNEPL